MAELLHPGVYVNIVSSGVRPIEGVGTSTAAFVGEAERGIPGRATFLTSFRDYEKAFGGHQAGDRGYLAQAVEAFFRAGGVRAYAVRVLPSSAEPAKVAAVQRTRVAPGQNEVAPKALSFAAKGKGKWGNDLRLSIEDDARFPSVFRIRVFLVESGVTRVVEDFQDLSMDPAAERYVADVIGRESTYVTVVDELSAHLASADPTKEGLVTVTQLVAQAPTLETAKVPTTGIKIHEGAKLTFRWGITGSEAEPASLTVVFDAVTLAAANAILTAEGGQTPPQIPAFSNKSTLVTTPTMLEALLRAAMPKVSAQQAVVTAANGELDPADALPAGVVDANPAAGKGAPVTPAQLLEILAVPGATGTRFVDSVLDLAADSDNVSIGAPIAPDADNPLLFDAAWLSVQEALATNVGRVLPGLGFASTKVRGYSKNSQANPLARPLATSSTPLKFANGSDGTNGARAGTTELIGSTADGTGLHALDRYEVNLVALPGRNTPDVLSAAIAYSDARGDCFYVADGPGAPSKDFQISAAEAKAFVDALPVRSNNAAMYFPWIQEPDPVGVGRNPTRFVPPSGLVCGIYARTDRSRGVWKAPAGIEAVVSGALGVQVDVGDADQDLLNPVNLNCVRLLSGAGIVVWGARSLTSDPEWRYVPVRRTALFLKESIRRGMQWAVFEPNDDTLWRQIQLNIHAFMLGLFRQGAFQGTTPEEAFRVQCDRETNPQELVDAGVVTARVEFAPLKPAEFVVIEISQKSLVGGS